MPRDENMIAALKRERAQYVSRGEGERAAQVDEQLRHYGYEPEGSPVVDDSGAPKDRAPQGDQRTADGDQGDTKKAPAVAKKTAASKRAQAAPSGD